VHAYGLKSGPEVRISTRREHLHRRGRPDIFAGRRLHSHHPTQSSSHPPPKKVLHSVRRDYVSKLSAKTPAPLKPGHMQPQEHHQLAYTRGLKCRSRIANGLGLANRQKQGSADR
jgi:hypothetical protein